MASTRIIRRRIKTTKNIRQITKAMEMVSASKMKRAQDQAISSKPYAQKLQEMIKRVVAVADPSKHPLLQQNPTGKHLLVLISSDKGLTGGLTPNLFKGTQNYIDKLNLKPSDLEFLIIGRKARDYLLRTEYPVTAEFSQLPDKISFTDSLPISQIIINGFTQNEYSKVDVLYMDFVSTLVQRFNVNHLLPISVGTTIDITKPDAVVDVDITEKIDYQFEPRADEILDWLLPYYVEILVYQMMLEAKASEHSARMVAMKSASDNASEVISELNLLYNKTRQAAITSELLDIVTASTSQG